MPKWFPPPVSQVLIFLAVNGPCWTASTQARVPAKPPCTSGDWHSQRTARVVSPRPGVTLWTPVCKPSSKVDWWFYMMLKKTLSTGWILWRLQHSQTLDQVFSVTWLITVVLNITQSNGPGPQTRKSCTTLHQPSWQTKLLSQGRDTAWTGTSFMPVLQRQYTNSERSRVCLNTFVTATRADGLLTPNQQSQCIHTRTMISHSR